MVWPFTSSSSNGDNDKSSDPYSRLDPSLRKFLDRESAPSYTPSKPPADARPPKDEVIPDAPVEPAPPPTLFPDGRYAHLWKTYIPPAEAYGGEKSDSEKLQDVVADYKQKRKDIKWAAIENCAAINEELDLCYRKPTLAQRAVMCRTEVRALDRCVTMNKQFLRALGYMSEQQSREERERIQMHADKLFTRMIAAEKEAKTAEEEGRPAPDPLELFRDVPKEEPLDYSEIGKKKLEERTKDMTPLEREIEERAFAAEVRANAATLKDLEQHREEVRRAREERLASGNPRLTDKIQRLFGW